ncbi:MAG: GntR family transcriptional regulator [Stellaceae bacterium]
MSQAVTALLRLRELILSGELAPGERLSELSMVDRLGVSRTPVRAALARLEEEGLLEPIPSGGFAVRAFTEDEIRDAVELRGTLEGLAARLAAERGVALPALNEMRRLLDRIDALIAAPDITEADFSAYVTLNEQVHARLVDFAGSAVVARQIGRVMSLPFASPSAFLEAQGRLPEARAVLVLAQEHHRAVLDAIEHREGTRAEAIMREHARLARRNLQLALGNQDALQLVRGGALIRHRLRA